jgi:hypothetical protein
MIQQAQNKRLTTEFLRGDSVSKIFDFKKESASARVVDPLIKNPSGLFRVELSYFYKPADNILNIFIHVP